MLERRLEPEVMDTVEDARDYDQMDHGTVNRAFVDDLLQFARERGFSEQFYDRRRPSRVLDVGTGTAQIPIELCGRGVGCQVTAIDLAAEMLKLASINIAHAGFEQAIRVELVDAKRMPFADGSFDVVISNSIVHHIPEPGRVFVEMLRVLRPGGLLFVRDLLRPHSSAEVDQLVTTYAGGESTHAQQLFRDSLHAALSLAEVAELAAGHGLERSSLTQTSDRHWTLAWRRPER